MSQVRNLRAMFESKGESCSPDRGRSPVLGLSLVGDPPRPLSKIRTNFVAVEKDGRIGLQRESNIEPTKTSVVTPATSAPTIISSTPNPVGKQPDLKTSSVAQEEAGSSRAIKCSASIASSHTRSSPASPVIAAKDAATPGNVKLEPEPSQSKLQPSKAEESKQGKLAATKSFATKVVSSKLPHKEGTSSTAKKSSVTAVKSPKPPAATDTNLSQKSTKREPRGTRESAKKVASIPSRSKTPVARSQAQAQTQVTSNTRKPPAAHAKHSSIPIVKSPTKQTSSSSLAAQSSSISRTGKPSFSDLRTAARSSSTKPADRSTSRASSVAPTIRRQPSSFDVKNQRPSLGLPPKKKETAVRQPPKEVDEGLLARMMRPTQSSQSKMTEKAPVTPPRKNNTSPRRPPTRNESAGNRRDRSAPSSAQRVPRPLSSLASPSRLNHKPPIVSPTLKFDDASSTVTGPAVTHVEEVTVSLSTTTIVDLGQSLLHTKDSNLNDGIRGSFDGAIPDVDIPKTPEALPSLETSTVTPNDVIDMEHLNSREPIEQLLDGTAAALQGVNANLGLEKQDDTSADGDVFGVPTKSIELHDFETY
ncbi:hypothetical protein Cpir12675_001830 [Ceratocystis pirilliformis]|uniref:Uncharacterized protein n=1 Tax=Ceratocystis pirilliformis TaxID=259994 RepID=A0ABR3ZD68_9PEZI